MADGESDFETVGLEVALDTVFKRHCCNDSPPKSKSYCAEFCQLVEEHTGHWQVPLPQLKVLWTALCSFTKATAAFPDDCQHVQHVLSSLALSFFELMLFFSKEEFVEKPLKGILSSFQECHSQLLRHRNVYLRHLKQIIRTGGPWEHPVLQGILKDTGLPSKEVKDYLKTELPVFFELRVRYLQACERLQEAKALAKVCLENCEAGNHLYFHQAYLTCLYKASLHEHLHKEMAEIDGRDAVEIICNTECIEKDELLLSLCKAFLTQQLLNGDMYYIWDLVFIWSRLHLRAHPCRRDFLDECLRLASGATNVRAIFPFIKLVTSELGGDGVHVCVELCARALQLCDMQDDIATRSLVCKTIAFLLPHDLEICRACALLVFFHERSLEAYKTVCLLYMHPDQEPHPHNSPVRPNVRFHILQMLKERLCFDPELWNLLNLRTHCLELMSDKVMKAAVLSDMKEDEEKEQSREAAAQQCLKASCVNSFNPCQCAPATAGAEEDVAVEPSAARDAQESTPLVDNPPRKRRKWKRRLGRRKKSKSDDEFADDPEITFNLGSSVAGNKPTYSLRDNQSNKENTSTSVKVPLNRKREYLSRRVKSQIFKRKDRKRRWLQGLLTLEQDAGSTDKMVKVKLPGKKRGRKPLAKLEYSYPDNELLLTKEEEEEEQQEEEEEEKGLGWKPVTNSGVFKPDLVDPLTDHIDQVEIMETIGGLEEPPHCVADQQWPVEAQTPPTAGEPPPAAAAAAAATDQELEGAPLVPPSCLLEHFHNYCMRVNKPDGDVGDHGAQPTHPNELNGDGEEELSPTEEVDSSGLEGSFGKKTWRDRVLRTQKYAHLVFHCQPCHKVYKGLNVMRHALSHLKRRKMRCILCRQRFKQLSFAKDHILQHINDMARSKSSSSSSRSSSEKGPSITNGEGHHSDNQEKVKSQTAELANNAAATAASAASTSTSAAVEVTATKDLSKPKLVKTKKPVLDRNSRIIKNLRTLIKKLAILHKGKVSEVVVANFTDEQVVILDSQVVIRGLSVPKGEEGGEGAENGGEMVYVLCPSESCDRVFLKNSGPVLKHILKFHLTEEKAVEKLFVWSKRKCSLCIGCPTSRQIQFLPHYLDHMKLHDGLLRCFCYHSGCGERFATPQALRDHVRVHQPLQARCHFPECDRLFASLPHAYDHEWRHYIPTPQRDELSRLARQKTTSAEAPWKQKVKVEEAWLQSRKPPLVTEWREAFKCDAEPEDSAAGSEADRQGGSPAAPAAPVAVNGCEDAGQETRPPSPAPPPLPLQTSPPTPAAKRHPRILCSDAIDVHDHADETSTMAEGIQKTLGEPHIAEHKSFKPEDPAYAPFLKAPFIRPPPSTYLNESVLSMRRRRTKEEAAPARPAPGISRTGGENQQAGGGEQKTRTRCDKCLSSFSSSQELEKHRALNTCSALFGFDSDDES